jgi:hypothetical protein
VLLLLLFYFCYKKHNKKHNQKHNKVYFRLVVRKTLQKTLLKISCLNLCFVVAVVVVRLNGCGAAACMHDHDEQETRSLCMAKQQVALTRMALDPARPKYKIFPAQTLL